MKPMLLTASTEIPIGEDWLYEAKYDGFRCMLIWDEEPTLISRNGNILNHNFPEIIDFCLEIKEQIKSFIPLTLDGEIVFLTNNFHSNFSVVQTRGRMRSQNTIKKHVEKFSCHFVVFDCLENKGKCQTNSYFIKRKEVLQKLFETLRLPPTINYEDINRLQAIDVFSDSNELWKKILVSNGEGIIAKRKTSKWISEKRTTNWLKIKNWRYVTTILTKYNKSNGFFHGAIYQDKHLVEVVTFKHGLKEEETNTLIALFQSNGVKISESIWELEPSICVEIACIDFMGETLREPRFNSFKLEMSPDECHWQQMQRQLHPIPESVQVTNPDKPIWPPSNILKDDYLLYLQNVSPYMLPFLRDRNLTLIRYPHGVPGESFYQKSSPDNVPDFVTTTQVGDTNFIICNNIESLLWLGNQLAIEFHIPFQTIHTNRPTEIVFDLDPPSVNEFHLAVEAALHMKAIFDQFELISFVKTSGGKGMQIYIPLPLDKFSYEETGIFTKFVCDFLIEQNPQWFTTERLKKNRNNKLYLDYVQHREGKTIIAPYSPRGNEKGFIATPLFWDEVNETLNPSMFTISAVLERINKVGNPFRNFRESENDKEFTTVLKQLKGLLEK
ncbi:DNA ligase D [Viridibacillus sp. FSL H7-0596]|uniref:DNA ligase D n=1 Tax=Viridibacillus sp. FSL H7-0596 TaxID=1928923 RepID=UPI00096C3E79|nr:DNA ligase D [Viridibacillus sp. FSL H7-0596]OMC88404.1 DNA ligase D [Viridibacillus sp. FSL H7-0596]